MGMQYTFTTACSLARVPGRSAWEGIEQGRYHDGMRSLLHAWLRVVRMILRCQHCHGRVRRKGTCAVMHSTVLANAALDGAPAVTVCTAINAIDVLNDCAALFLLARVCVQMDAYATHGAKPCHAHAGTAQT